MTKNAAEFSIHDHVFDRIAGRYDFLCDVFSLGMHRLWKRHLVSYIVAEPWERMLDEATGTGDIALRVSQAQSAHAGKELIASDMSEPMLKIARHRAALRSVPIDFRVLDAESMPTIKDESLDLFSISLALKICDRRKVMLEAFRVLRPGGRFISLEASNIIFPWLNRLYLRYMDYCVPLIGWIAVRGDASAYRYLLKGIHDFPDAHMLAEELRDVGFEQVTFERISLGIVAIHVAYKPKNIYR